MPETVPNALRGPNNGARLRCMAWETYGQLRCLRPARKSIFTGTPLCTEHEEDEARKSMEEE